MIDENHVEISVKLLHVKILQVPKNDRRVKWACPSVETETVFTSTAMKV